jgi:dephospho-CoA kinase
VLDAPVLFEAGAGALAEEIWVVEADETKVINRAASRTGLPEEQIRARVRSQLSNEERIKGAQVIIYNNGTPEDLKQKVRELWERLKT